jgi:ribosomal protein S18 acetylase RimI-like enzyme
LSKAFEIRDYTPSDGAACHRLRRNAFLGVFSKNLAGTVAQVGADSYGVFEFAERIGAMETSVATIEGAVVGFCTIRVDSLVRAEVLYLYIDSQSRGAGIGSRLMHQAEKRVLSSHPELVSLYLDTAAPDYNQGFWERMGYRYVGPSTCDYPSGKIPAVRLEKTVVSRSG